MSIRRYRDRINFESADVSCFLGCDKLLPAIKLLEIEVEGPFRSPAWSLLRIRGARYYESAKGLLQSGFCATEKFLLKWIIYLEKQRVPNGSTESIMKQGSVISAPKFRKGTKQGKSSNQNVDRVNAVVDHKKSEDVSFTHEPLNGNSNNIYRDIDPSLRIGSNVVNDRLRSRVHAMVSSFWVLDGFVVCALQFRLVVGFLSCFLK
ncbi:hypothetical protein RJT34_07976 [Clitoria ternatea]|uniref:Nonsense-mediated mRNA decay factor SMG8 n=1 Tax=Clitoria ternatea TaxID=43366 RepID=A0AAN9K5M4_CLITE